MELAGSENVSVPSSQLETAIRLREIERSFGVRALAAEAAGVAKSTFQSWVEGKSAPPLLAMAKITAASGFSLDWLAYGVEPKRRARTEDVSRLAPPAPVIDPDWWHDIFSVVTDLLLFTDQPLVLHRRHRVTHDLYNRSAAFASEAERRAVLRVLVADCVAAEFAAQPAHERALARRELAPPSAPSESPE